MTRRWLVVCFAFAATVAAQNGERPPAGPPPTARSGAVFDPTGYWVSIIDEDWRWRMVTPPKGEFESVPLNAEGKKAGNAWDPEKDEKQGNACKAWGAAGLMRLPERLHITWADDQTLKIETDSGQQTRLIHFDGSKWKGGEPQMQGDSIGAWDKQGQQRGFTPVRGLARAGNGGTLKVVTSHMREGYLRKNGVPYSSGAVLTEYFDRIQYANVPYLILTSAVDDPKYLSDTFITSEQFKHEPDAANWRPTPCKAR